MSHIELERSETGLSRVTVHDDAGISQLFESTYAAMKFITRNEQLPEHVVTEAALSALRPIQQHKDQQRAEALMHTKHAKLGNGHRR